MWKAAEELALETKGSQGGFIFPSLFPVAFDWSSSGRWAVIRTLSSSCFCPWQFFLFSTHLSMAFFLHSSIRALFNELASTACTPSTAQPYISLDVALFLSDTSSILFVLLPLLSKHSGLKSFKRISTRTANQDVGEEWAAGRWKSALKPRSAQARPP